MVYWNMHNFLTPISRTVNKLIMILVNAHSSDSASFLFNGISTTLMSVKSYRLNENISYKNILDCLIYLKSQV